MEHQKPGQFYNELTRYFLIQTSVSLNAAAKNSIFSRKNKKEQGFFLKNNTEADKNDFKK